MGDPLNPVIGDQVFDGSEFNYLLDPSPDQKAGLMTVQPGFDEVQGEVAANMAAWAAKAGMTQDDIDTLVVLNARIARISVFAGPIRKFYEQLVETRAILEDERQRIILNLGASVVRRGKKNKDLLGKYQKTCAYRSANAKKAAQARRKQQAAAKKAAAAAAATAAAATTAATAATTDR